MATRQRHTREHGANDQAKVGASVLGITFWSWSTIVHREAIRRTEHASRLTSRMCLHTFSLPRISIAITTSTITFVTLSFQMCRELRFAWCGEKPSLGLVSSLINKPDAPIQLKFNDLHA